MTKHHYVYKSFEEEGREYIGIRSCNCLPEKDTKYFGSFKDKTFNPTGKIILFTGETRQEVAEIEIELHDFFDVAVNPQFANRAKAKSIKFDTTGVPNTAEQKKKKSVAMSGENNPCYGRTGEKNPNYGVPHTEEWKKAQSERMSGENNPNYGVPWTEEQKQAHSERMSGEKHPMYGRTGALNARSKAIIVIEPDGTQRHFVNGREAARELEIQSSNLCRYLKIGYVPKKGKWEGWQFVYENR
jgi:hypothetical protein